MTEQLHPAATQHLPPFVTAPGETDVLFVAMAIFVLLAVIGIGILYFKIHALPEQLAHTGEKILFEIIAVLTLLALFTHNHAFWIAALLLAFVPLPDFMTPLKSIASSLDRIATSKEPSVATPPHRIAASKEPPVATPPHVPEESFPAGDQPTEQRGPDPCWSCSSVLC